MHPQYHALHLPPVLLRPMPFLLLLHRLVECLGVISTIFGFFNALLECIFVFGREAKTVPISFIPSPPSVSPCSEESPESAPSESLSVDDSPSESPFSGRISRFIAFSPFSSKFESAVAPFESESEESHSLSESESPHLGNLHYRNRNRNS